MSPYRWDNFIAYGILPILEAFMLLNITMRGMKCWNNSNFFWYLTQDHICKELEFLLTKLTHIHFRD